MKYSIIIPYYNADRWIGRMLNSLLTQDLQQDDYEIIVVDDGSTNKPQILMEYVHRFPCIRYHRQENAGPGAARNTGLGVAQGDFIFFCDSDDYIADNVLYELYQIANSRHLDMLFFDVPRVSETEIPQITKRNFDRIVEFTTGEEFLAKPVVGKITTGVWQFIISREFIERANLSFPTDRIMNEDSSFWIDAILAAGPVASVDVDVYFYVQNPQSLIHLSGRVEQRERYADNMMIFVRKLSSILNDNNLINDMPQGCIDNIKWVRNQKAYIMLVNVCHLPKDRFDYYVSELKSLQAYPKAFGRYKWLKWLSLLPGVMKLRNKRFNRKNTKQ